MTKVTLHGVAGVSASSAFAQNGSDPRQPVYFSRRCPSICTSRPQAAYAGYSRYNSSLPHRVSCGGPRREGAKGRSDAASSARRRGVQVAPSSFPSWADYSFKWHPLKK
jgi:hypothetical protein